MSYKRTTVVYEKPGEDHTEETLKFVLETAKDRKIETILVSTSSGKTGLKAVEVFKGSGLKIVFVTHQYGYPAKGKQMMPDDVRANLEKTGRVITCTDVLTGSVELGSGRQRPEVTEPQTGSLPSIVPPVNVIIANTLRLFSQGTKVCVEIALMAADCGGVGIDKPVISVAGSHAGADTALILTPAASNRIRDLKVHEVLVKPQ